MLIPLSALLACRVPSEPGVAAEPGAAAEPGVETPARAADPRPPAERRIVAIGDLHGDRDAALEALVLAGLTDAEGRWIAGDTVLVQTGDTTDRGPDSRGVIDLLRQVAEEAPKSGGEVHLLLGNHEVMNLQGDWRYVSDADIAGFGGKSRRLSAFSRGGDYGAFLGTLPVAVKVDDTVFVHGGITPELAARGLDALNAEARAGYFDAPDPSHALLGSDGPLWYRGYVNEPEAQACPRLEEALGHLGAKRMVVGHTTRRDGRIQSRCGGRLAVIDIGISAHYGGHTGVWESRDADAWALMPSGPIDLPDP